MFRLIARLNLLDSINFCVLAASLAMLLSATPVESSSSSTSSSQQAEIEQSFSEPPSPNEPTFSEHLFLPQVSKTERGSEEHSPQEVVHIADADANSERILPPIANLSTFVSNTGGDLDQYLNRAQTFDGKLTFTIAITAPVLPESAVNPLDGFLNPSFAVTLTNRHVLPKKAMLTLAVWDVDDDAGLACPEIDYVSINGNRLRTFDLPAGAALRGANGEWRPWSVSFSTDLLRFPKVADVEGGQPPLPAINEIAIEVDAECEATWAVEVDWGAIVLVTSSEYPTLLVHGWTGDQETFKTFNEFATIDGYSMTIARDLGEGIEDWKTSAKLLYDQIQAALAYYSVPKVNIDYQ